jgi:hypothetical protein
MNDYDTDLLAWSEHQAGLLRRHASNEIDWDNLAEEIEALGRSQKHEVRRRLARLCQHLLKWAFQPDFRSRSWRTTITMQRQELELLLEDSPSLLPFLAEALPRAYRIGRAWAEQETGVMGLPETCPWSAEAVLEEGFLPEAHD